MSRQPAGDETPQLLEPSFRIGSLTAIGVLAAFSLTFLTTWAALPGKWEAYDLFGLLLLVVGAVLQLVAIALLLRVDSLERPRYERAVRWFLFGVALVMIGITISLTGDALTFVADVG
jgi:hypothetical protein